VDARIDQMLKENGLDAWSDDGSVDSEFEEEAEKIEVREKIEEIKRIISVSTLYQEKVMLVDRLHEFAKEIGTRRTIEIILDLIIPKVIQNEKPPVKKALIPQFIKLAKFLIASKDGYTAVLNNLLGEYNTLLSDQNPDISKKACESLLSISNLLSQEDRSIYILPIILTLAHDSEEEDSRCLALQLLSHFSSLVEEEYLENLIVNEIISLSDDPVLNVRRTTVVFLVNICKNVKKEIFENKLFPIYYKLAYDNVWGVRKAAVEILPDISEISSPELRAQHLVDLYKKFTQDASKWVKMAAHQYLGPFIATLKGQVIDKSLVSYYISMGDPRRSSFNSDVAFHCAYNFPAVLVTLGKEKWPDLKRLYKILVKDNQWKVRKTLSYSLHEVAKILGPELTEEELLPVFENFLKDSGKHYNFNSTIDEIRNGVLIHLADFIRILNPKVRERCISMLGHIQSESNHWRLRKLLASQLKDCVELFEPKVVYKIHVPIALKLCKDDVAEVRTKACCNIPAIILKTLQKEKSKDYFERVVKEICKFGDSDRYVQRQVFIMMCANILTQDLPMFCKYFMDKFIEKQNDKVVNVRIVMARYCGEFLSNFVEPDHSETSSEKSIDVIDEEKIYETDQSNIEKNKLQYERLLNEKKFMKMIVRLKNDEKLDVSSQITSHVNFDKLMSFIKQNEHRVEDIDLYEE
jgi:serine/threonine-protein phosphatase 4 regulatory subunit 1